jgi:hypothetical protein
MKRLFAGLVCFAVSSMSYAGVFESHGNFSFKGEWKHKAGANGTWDSTMVVEKVSSEPKSVKVTNTINIQNGQQIETMTSVMVLEQTGDKFFDVKIEGKVVGSGYCYGIQCHYGVYHAATKSMTEETMSFVDEKIYTLGSHFSHESGKTAWKGAGEAAAE